MIKNIIIILILFSHLQVRTSSADIEEDSNYALILAYKNIGEDNNIGLNEFKAHINLLSMNNYNILPIKEIIKSLENKDNLAGKTIGISIDGEEKYIKNIIAPILKDKKLPFTIFIKNSNLNSSNHYMDWSDIKKLDKNKSIDIGISLNTELNKIIYEYRDNLNSEPKLIAYPFGEYSLKTDNIIKNYPDLSGFTLDASLIHENSNFLRIPRLQIGNEYSDIERLSTILHSKPLPAYDILPIDNYTDNREPVIGFTITDEIKDLKKLKCFASNQGKLKAKNIGENRIEIRTKLELSNERTSITCTLPIEKKLAGENLYTRRFSMMLTHHNNDNNSLSK